MDRSDGPGGPGAPDLVIVGGTVIDPGSGLHARRQVAIADRRIVAIEPDGPVPAARNVLDATNRLVVPGLVDLHVHVYWGVADLSVEADPTCLGRGATTVVDAGSAGANTFPGFRRSVVDASRGRILAYLNISAMGALYLVALTNLFAMLPAAPGYVGTFDAAVIFGVKAIGGTESLALSYLLLLRFMLFVPITVVGLIVLVARYGGWAALRAATRVQRTQTSRA